jgi:hypothetical protein
MPLIYSFVARGNVVLADYTSYTGNFSTVALQVSQRHKRVPEADQFARCLHSQHSRMPGAHSLRRSVRPGSPPITSAMRRRSTDHQLPPLLRPTVCRRWRREGRAPTPNSHTPVMDTVSGSLSRCCSPPPCPPVLSGQLTAGHHAPLPPHCCAAFNYLSSNGYSECGSPC